MAEANTLSKSVRTHPRLPTLVEVHSDLYHYTDWSGLEGILKSQTLWATHYASLNDTSEIMHMREVLIQDLIPYMRGLITDLRKKSSHVKREVSKAGGVHIVSKQQAAIIVDTLYEVTFGKDPDHIKVLKEPFAEPFIISFCTHTQDDKYTKENGLLSQWRGYGGREKFAIIFDTKKLTDLVSYEGKKYYYSTIAAGDVIYDGDVEKRTNEFLVLYDKMKEIHTEMLNDITDNISSIFGPFVTSVARFKHRAFMEEREVRIIACPYTQEIIDRLIYKTPNMAQQIRDEVRNKKLKAVHERGDGNDAVPYIALFDFDKKAKLPIKRIIVGPHKEQAKLAVRVKKLVRRMNVAVTCSETPYTGT